MSVTRPRGPLPARVYWFRRLLVLGVACALVLGIGQVLGRGDTGAVQPAAQHASVTASGGSAGAPSAVATGDARPTRIGQAPGQTLGEPAGRAAGAEAGGRKRAARAPLPMPTGPCQDSDVRVVPSLEEDARAGGDVRFTLRLTTFESPACTWKVSADSVAVRLTSGSDRIWSSQDCSGAVPTEAVVLRRRRVTRVEVTWSGRRSDPDCSRTTGWAEPGYYHVATAAMGSEPASQQFELLSPAPVTITPTPTPRRKAGD